MPGGLEGVRGVELPSGLSRLALKLSFVLRCRPVRMLSEFAEVEMRMRRRGFAPAPPDAGSLKRRSAGKNKERLRRTGELLREARDTPPPPLLSPPAPPPSLPPPPIRPPPENPAA